MREGIVFGGNTNAEMHRYRIDGAAVEIARGTLSPANKQKKKKIIASLAQKAQEICHLVVTLGCISAPYLCKTCFVLENRCRLSGSNTWPRIASTAARTLLSRFSGPIWQQFTMALLRAGSSRWRTYSSSS